MPYINQEDRSRISYELDTLVDAMSFDDVGMLNYAITYLINKLLSLNSYSSINEAIGILECAKMEFYRRIAIPYEDKKIQENGDVY